jgi:hypothetical protein
MKLCTTPSAPVIGKKKPDLEDLNADSSCVVFDRNASQRTGRSNDNKRTEILVARCETIASGDLSSKDKIFLRIKTKFD